MGFFFGRGRGGIVIFAKTIKLLGDEGGQLKSQNWQLREMHSNTKPANTVSVLALADFTTKENESIHLNDHGRISLRQQKHQMILGCAGCWQQQKWWHHILHNKSFFFFFTPHAGGTQHDFPSLDQF